MIELNRDGPFDVYDSRLKYGVSKSDAFSLSHYLSIIMSNGLTMLADMLHGAPVGYPNSQPNSSQDETDFNAWQSDLRKYAAIFARHHGADDRHGALYETYGFPENITTTVELDNGMFQLVFPDPDTELGKKWKDYTENCRAYDEETSKLLTEALNWMATWYESLWD